MVAYELKFTEAAVGEVGDERISDVQVILQGICERVVQCLSLWIFTGK
jgi:hypothetical protein